MSAPPTIHVYRSNRTEVLADLLAEVVRVPQGGPFDPETIVVQGRGMAVWLSQHLARAHRVVANTEFTYPRQLVTRAFRAVLGEDAVTEETSAAEGLLFPVMAALPKLLPLPELRRVAHYLSRDTDGTRRFQLASRITARFDQYLTYRPDMIRAWEAGGDFGIRAEDAWQPLLFRALGTSVSAKHVAALEIRYAEALRAGTKPLGLPARVSLFGLTSVPPLFMRAIARLAPEVGIHLFLFAPSAGPESEETSALGASLGALGKEFDVVLAETLAETGVTRVDTARFAPPEGTSLLGELQRSVYEGKPDPRDESSRALLADGDTSVTVHSCHGPMREVEVLHDQLLERLTRRGSTLEPHQIVVMTPDVDAYAPFIEAVFDRAKGARYVPYRISDRSVRTESPVIDAFQRILALAGGRAEASAVLDLLNLGPIQERFGIDANELDRITAAVVDSGVRWGVDEAHREAHGQPRVRENTWRFGLDRLLLGYAMPTDGERTFHGVLPFEELEGKGAELLGSLAEFTERLFETLASLEAKRSVARFAEDLARALGVLVASEPRTAWQHTVVLTALRELGASAEHAGFTEDVGLDVIRALLDEKIDTSYPERGFLANGVTFCAMLPMRTIPFRVVALLGMNDGAFPRSSRSVDFDLLRTGAPRPGDRDRRKDDRYLFLEALLAARESLLVTYTGQSIRDNAERPPSVVVSELVDRAERFARVDAADTTAEERAAKLHDRLVVKHPLQGFSPRYFDGRDPRLYSFVEAYRSGAVHAGAERVPVPPFFEAALAPEEETDRTLRIEELVRFFQDPVAYLLTRRLGVHLKEDVLDVPDREPVEVEGLAKWRLGNAVLEQALAGMSTDETRALARARGELPLGRYGDFVHRDVSVAASEIASRVRTLRGDAPVRAISVDRVLPDGTRLVGELTGVGEHGVFRHQFSRNSANYQTNVWLRHVVLAWAAMPQARSVLVGRHDDAAVETVTFREMTDPEAYLTKLVALYRAGLSAPLRFAPQASMRYAEAVARGKPSGFAMDAARKDFRDGLGGDLQYAPHLERVFGVHKPGFEDVAAAVGDFEELARVILLPMLERRVIG